MAKFIIEGRHSLTGTVIPSGNKNAAFPLISAALLTDQPVTLHNLPAIGDVQTMLRLVEDLGVDVTHHSAHSVTLQARELKKVTPDPDMFSAIRGSLVLMGSLLAREGRVNLCFPGGDQIGRRRIDTHLLALSSMGAEVGYNGDFTLRGSRLCGVDLLLDEASVTGTENAILAAAMAEGTTILRNAASEPHVQELCHLLTQMGARIDGIGSNMVTIHGVGSLNGAEFTLGPDYLEIGSFIGLAAVTQSEFLIKNAAPEYLRMMLLIFDRLGVRPEVRGQDLYVPPGQPLTIVPDIGDAIPKVDDGPWPAFPADMISVALVVATQANGTVLFHEKMYESRLYFVDELIRMGARIILCDPHRAVIQGPSKLHGETLYSPDIRAGMSLLIAAFCAEGVSEIRNIGQIDRGYERIEEKLQALGARIERVED